MVIRNFHGCVSTFQIIFLMAIHDPSSQGDTRADQWVDPPALASLLLYVGGLCLLCCGRGGEGLWGRWHAWLRHHYGLFLRCYTGCIETWMWPLTSMLLISEAPACGREVPGVCMCVCARVFVCGCARALKRAFSKSSNTHHITSHQHIRQFHVASFTHTLRNLFLALPITNQPVLPLLHRLVPSPTTAAPLIHPVMNEWTKNVSVWRFMWRHSETNTKIPGNGGRSQSGRGQGRVKVAAPRAR